jgi:hypothetical protein
MEIEIVVPSRSHLLTAINSLVRTGWTLQIAPDNGYLVRNGQLLVLKTAKRDTRLRLFIYKVTGSSRGKPHERRIEITSTYQKGLLLAKNYQDVVLGIEQDLNIFVGVDPRRIAHGGPTGNASSFFDIEGLYWKQQDEILIRPRSAKLFPEGIEYHAFFKPFCLAEYLLNVEAIHNGSYSDSNSKPLIPSETTDEPISLVIPSGSARGDVLILEEPLTGSKRSKIQDDLIEAYEQGNWPKLRRARLSPEQFREIKKRCDENGSIGEEIAINYERRRLARAGKPDLASKVRWVSRESVTEGYDILSYETNGTERLIEVKATSGNKRIFEISSNEWQTAINNGSQYYIYFVSEVRTQPHIEIFPDPCYLEETGVIQRTASGWIVKIK